MSKEIDWSKAPEGATHARDCGWDHPDWYKIVDGVLMVHSCNEGWDRSGYSDMGEVPNLQTRPAKEWTGTGLPPVGTVCEYNASAKRDEGEELWCGVEIKYRSEWVIVFECVSAPVGHDGSVGVELFGDVTHGIEKRFRPISTQAQIEAEEREKAVSDMLSMWMDCGSARDFCEYLHDHGYRKTEDVK